MSSRAVHVLKCRSGYFDAVLSNAKPFEVRENDRGFHVGEILELVEVSGGKSAVTGRRCRRLITYILDLDEFYQLVQLWRYGSSGMNERDVDGWVVLGLAPISDRELDNNVASILHEAEHAAEVDAELQAEAEADEVSP